ncbi:VOC family protein [Flavobacterium selenitireducens]|uniref:VOC family protein n=1 Tax=Flavobacterium selenitireducens TaxID=2722704 RepID=UPI00168BF91C|nr:VOC family protein [Flavobacterium selenitireducens]MBD3583631.1 VOC family protein [Flavobacterium selenitireducens]
MASIIPYLYFDGKCEEAFEFYHSVLGGKIPYIGRYGDMPKQTDEYSANNLAEDVHRVMHMSLETADGSLLLGSDVPTRSMPGFEFTEGNNVAISLNANDREQALAFFNGLSAGGQVTMPLADTFWGAYFGMWVDKFGISWMVNYDDPSKMPNS